MLTVSVHKLRLHGKHGLYPEEAVLGGWYEVDVDISVAATAEEEWPFLDYTQISRIVQEVFSHPVPLLETLVRSIYAALKSELNLAGPGIRITVRKLHPPMPGDVGYAAVTYEG